MEKIRHTFFLFILYKLQVMKVFLSSSKHYDIIAVCVILNPNILRENIVFERQENTDNNIYHDSGTTEDKKWA